MLRVKVEPKGLIVFKVERFLWRPLYIVVLIFPSRILSEDVDGLLTSSGGLFIEKNHDSIPVTNLAHDVFFQRIISMPRSRFSHLNVRINCNNK